MATKGVGPSPPEGHEPQRHSESRRALQTQSSGPRIVSGTTPRSTKKMGFWVSWKRNQQIDGIKKMVSEHLPEISPGAVEALKKELQDGNFTGEWLNVFAQYLNAPDLQTRTFLKTSLQTEEFNSNTPLISAVIETLYDRSLEEISNLVDDIASRLPGRITENVLQPLRIFLGLQSKEWLDKFITFLHEPQARRRAEIEGALYMMNDSAVENPILPHLMQELTFAECAHNTQVLDYALDTTNPRSKPYLHTINRLPGALLFEIRHNEVLITHPVTKETRCFSIDHPQTDGDAAAFREIVRSLNESSIPEMTFQSVHDVIKMRHLYLITGEDGQRHLSIAPQGMFDAEVCTTLDPAYAIEEVREAIRSVEGRFETRPLGSLTHDLDTIYIEARERETEAGNFLDVTFKLEKKQYIAQYPMEEGETREDVARRIASDNTLERDILLAKAEFL